MAGRGKDRIPQERTRVRRAMTTDELELAEPSGLSLGYDGLSIVAAVPIKVDTDGVGLNIGTGLQLDGDDLAVYEAEIDHDLLLNYVANEHIDWTGTTESLLTTGGLTVDSDSNGLLLGDGQDAKIYYSGSDLVLNSAVVGSGSVVLPKTSGIGLKIDVAAPTFGWRDLLGEIRTRGVGATDPNDATYRGNIKAYQFTVGDEAWFDYHIPHDYVAGTDIHIHFHWSHTSDVVTGGSVTWGADLTYAKGHDQAAFSAPVVPTVVGTASTTQYQHIITEVQVSASSPSATQIDTDDLEPDGVIMVRVYLSANDITSSGAVPDPFLHFADVHYQSTNVATKDKVPDFYVQN